MEVTGRVESVHAYHNQWSYYPVYDNTEAYLDPYRTLIEYVM